MESKSEYERGRGLAMGFGALVYVGVVIAASTLFISFVLTAFPPNAYFSRGVMTVAGLLVGLSMLAFPVALHTWTVEKVHRRVTTILYYVEMIIIAFNTVVAFMTLLSRSTDFVVPEWATGYEPFSVGAIVYTLAAWGTVFLLDPAHTSTRTRHEAAQRFDVKVAAKELEFLDSVEGEDAVMAAARAKIVANYDPSKFSGEKKHFGSGSKKPEPSVGQLVYLRRGDDGEEAAARRLPRSMSLGDHAQEVERSESFRDNGGKRG